MAAGQSDEALAAHEQAGRLAPQVRLYGIILDIAKREAVDRDQPSLPGVGMPPDPSLWDLPADTAWMLWNRNQAQHQQERLESGVPDPTPHASSPIQPFGTSSFGLPPSEQNR